MVNADATKAIVRDYLHARAQIILKTLPSASSEDPNWPKCLRLIQGIVPISHAMSLASIQDMAIVAYGFGKTEKYVTAAQRLAYQAFSSTTSLIDELAQDAIPAFTNALMLSSSDDIDDLDSIDVIYRTVRCLHSLVVIVPLQALDIIVQSRELLQSLAQCYDTKLARKDTEVSSIRLRAALAKVSIMDTLHILLSHLMSVTSRFASTRLSEHLLGLLERPAPPSSSQTLTPFLNRSLLGDYEASYNVSDKLHKILSDHPRMPYITSLLKMRSGISSQGTHPIGGLSIIFDSVTPSEPLRGNDSKGKSKGSQDDVVSQPVTMNPAIRQVLDILPNENPTFIEKCLAHPSFSGSVEHLIGALLEGTPLPDGLDTFRSTIVDTSLMQEPSLVDSRRNAFDDDPLDFSKLKIGKNRGENADTVLRDKAFAMDMKEDILRRAREQVEEEEEEAREARGVLNLTVAFSDELSGGELDGAPRLKLAQEGEGSEDEDADGTGPKTDEMIENILELAYLKDPKLFDRDAGTRRSKSRQDLKAETGWGDEQIEGWRIMLERNPRKDHILNSKHEFSGNTPLPPDQLNEVSGRGRGQSSRGRGGGRGSGRGSSDNVARDRARKDRAGNQNRKRGRDKKMARGVIPPT